MKIKFIFIVLGSLFVSLAWANKPTFYPMTDIKASPMANITASPMTDITAYPTSANLTSPVLISPIGNVTGNSLVYQWNAVETAKYYRLLIEDSNGTFIINQQYSANQLDCSSNNICQVTPLNSTISGINKWWVSAIDDADNQGAWSEVASFSASGDINNTGYTDYFNLNIDSPLAVNASVNYQTRDGTAKAGIDYIPKSGSATIIAGQTSTKIAIDILISGTGKTYDLVITNPVGAEFPENTPELIATHRIGNDITSQYQNRKANGKSKNIHKGSIIIN
jgi:hypothetical protein